jgi:hypothetical protein
MLTGPCVALRDHTSDCELAVLEMNLRGDIFQDFKKPAARALRIKLAHTPAAQTEPKGLLSYVPHLHRGSKRVTLLVEARWQPASHSGTSGTLTFLLKQAAGLPAIRGATLAWVSILVVESAEALPRLVSGSVDRTIAMWDVWTGARVQSLRGHTAEVTQVLLAERYGRQLVVSGSRDKVSAVSSRTHVPLPPDQALFIPACVLCCGPVSIDTHPSLVFRAVCANCAHAGDLWFARSSGGHDPQTDSEEHTAMCDGPTKQS